MSSGAIILCGLALAGADALSGEAVFHQDVLFHSGESSYFCFRIPAIVVSSKGTVLAFAEARKTNCEDWDQIDLVLKRSEDAGKTWSDLRVLFHDGTRSVNQPSPILDRSTGVLWLVFCKDNQQVFVTHSADDGANWSSPREITSETKDPTWKYVAAGPGHGIQLSNGRLLVAAWGDASPGPVTWPPAWDVIEFTFAMYSDDHGSTWHRGRPMYENLTEEAMAVETSGRRVYMTLRSRQDQHRRAHAWSEDGGYSWSLIQFDQALPDPPAEGSIIRLPGDGADSAILFANPASATDRSHLTIRMSRDECRTWPVSRVLYEGHSAYSDLAVANDRTVLCLFEADQYSKLILARFNAAWVKEGSIQ
ncbi:MAG: sialidase family protein [Bryobacteraceae bacterium]|jgi:sialidase-1